MHSRKQINACMNGLFFRAPCIFELEYIKFSIYLCFLITKSTISYAVMESETLFQGCQKSNKEKKCAVFLQLTLIARRR